MYRKNKNNWVKHLDFMILDLICLQVAFFLAYTLRHRTVNLYTNYIYANLSIVLILIDVCLLIFLNTLKNVLKRGYLVEFIATIKHVAIVELVAVLYLFSVKDDRYKSEAFLEGEKEFYTTLINSYISDPEQHLKVFDKNSVYLPTKKIGKNNPKEAEIKADNEARQEWNRTADMALVTGIAEAKIMEIKQTEIQDKASESIRKSGWLPDMFRSIVGKAKDFLQTLIREQDMPPKPTLNINMTEFRIMQQLMIRVQDSAKEIKHLQNRVLPKLKQELKDTTGLFKGKERKALAERIQQTEDEISEKLDKLPDILKEYGYPDVQAFMATYREMEGVVECYEREVWEYNLKLKQKEKPTKKPPEKQSVLKHLREIQERTKQKPPQRQRKKSFDRDSR